MSSAAELYGNVEEVYVSFRAALVQLCCFLLHVEIARAPEAILCFPLFLSSWFSVGAILLTITLIVISFSVVSALTQSTVVQSREAHPNPFVSALSPRQRTDQLG